MVTFGLLNEEMGRGCSSVRSLLTVHGMVQFAILRWGKEDQKKKWLPRLAMGEVIGAFGLTEPGAGSDAAAIETSAAVSENSYVLNGTKVWTTFGQIADLVLVFGKQDGRICAFLVESDRPGFSATPVSGLLGTRASMVATLRLDSMRHPQGEPRWRRGVRIQRGRFGGARHRARTAWPAAAWALRRPAWTPQSNMPLPGNNTASLIKDHQLIRKMITEMVVNVRAARSLCYRAGQLKEAGDPRTMMETLVAKYFASKAATQSANDAVQIHGANGCSSDYPVQRYYRDVKIMEIIEGSTQILEINIAKEACDMYGSAS